MVAVHPALLVEGLLADITDLRIGEVLGLLELHARDVFDVGGLIAQGVPSWIWMTSPTNTDLPSMLFSRVSCL
jgi:hypothetical protein